MKRLLVACVLAPGTLFLFGNCATDDDEDPFPIRSAATANEEEPVAGATPAPAEQGVGFKW